MNNQSLNWEKAFIRSVIIISVVLLMLFSVVIFRVVSDIDNVRAEMAERAVDKSNLDKAISLVDKISDEDISNKATYNIALKEQELGLYSEAAKHFEALGTYSDSAKKYSESRYLLAAEYFDSKDFQQAKDIFASLGAFLDSADRETQCSYEIALIEFNQGEYMKALSMFVALGQFNDSEQMAYQSALAMTGDEDSARIIVNSGGLSAEAVEKAAQIAQLRAQMPIGKLDAGNYHTVYLKADGTVAACGDNSFGQCEVGAWNNVTQVSAGAEHTVALKADGTVVACGNNKYQQCEVSQWKDVVYIATSDYDTIGLKSDGSIVATGYHKFDSITQDQPIKNIFAGSYAAAVLTENDVLRSSHKSIKADDTQIMLDLLIGTGYTAAHYADGTLKSAVLPGEVPDLAYVVSGSRGIIGVKTDGTVYSHFFRDTDAIDFTSLGNINLCAIGTEHYVFLTADNTLLAFGDNSFGQCDVSSLQ